MFKADVIATGEAAEEKQISFGRIEEKKKTQVSSDDDDQYDPLATNNRRPAPYQGDGLPNEGPPAVRGAPGTEKNSINELLQKLTQASQQVPSESLNSLISSLSSINLSLQGKVRLIQGLLSFVAAQATRQECLDQFVSKGGVTVLSQWAKDIKYEMQLEGRAAPEYQELFGVMVTLLDAVPIDWNLIKKSKIGKTVNSALKA